MEIIGREVEVGFSTEAIRGTAETAVNKWERKVAATILERAEHVTDDATMGVMEDSHGRRVTQKYIEGTLDGIVHADSIGYLFSSIYGKVVTTPVSGSVNDHEFTLKQNVDHQSLTIFAKDGGVQQLALAGCMVNTLEISATIDDYVRFSAAFIGETAIDNTETPSYDTEYDFIGCDIEIKIADTEADLAGATAIKAKDVTVTHDQGGIRDHILGSCTPAGVYNSRNSLEGEFTLNFTDEIFKDLYLSDKSKYMSITIQGTADIGGGNNPSITYVFNRVQFNDWNRDGGADELVTQPISFKAYYNEIDGEASKVTLRNLTSTYPNVPTS